MLSAVSRAPLVVGSVSDASDQSRRHELQDGELLFTSAVTDVEKLGDKISITVERIITLSFAQQSLGVVGTELLSDI